MLVNNEFIVASGSPSFEKQRLPFPSGNYGIPLDAELQQFNSTFGFNQQPHSFTFQYVPEGSISVNHPLPMVGSGVSFFINDFFVRGRIKHADYTIGRNNSGKVLTVVVEDFRTDLNDYYIDTYGLFGRNDAPSVNIIDVRHWYIKTRLETGSISRDIAVRDLRLLEENGASYRQIYEAIEYFEQDVGNITGVLSQLPEPEIVEAQLPPDPEAFRFRFKAQPLLQAISKVLNDISYDFYYNMAESKINVINRKFAVNIDENNIPIENDTAPILTRKFGTDEGERPTRVILYGAEMEGLVGQGQLQVRSGAYGLTEAEYDLGITGVPVFNKGWTAKLKYIGPDGRLIIYEPEDRELALALKSMEYWAQYHNIDNRIGNTTFDSQTGNTGLQLSLSGSGVGSIPNRRTEDRQWIVDWFQRVKTYAQNHFGRTYVLDPSGSFNGAIDDIEVVNAAWCNIENLTEEDSFIDGYKIDDTFAPLQPFWDPDNNKMRAFTVFSKGTKWGVDGEQTPSDFAGWSETEDFQFVPVEVRRFDSSRNRFTEEFLTDVGRLNKGVVVRLPAMAWDPDQLIEDQVLSESKILGSVKNIFNGAETGRTTLDIPNPFIIPTPYLSPGNVALPIQVKRRYGLSYPSVWTSGNGVSTEVTVREDLAPWNYEPRGLKNSVQLMEDEALSALDGRIVNRNLVTFGEVTKVGLPVISFDQFADQSPQDNGFGIVSHGITSLNVSKDAQNYWITKYNVKSHFPRAISAVPVNEGANESFEFTLRRIEEDIRRARPRPIAFEAESISLPTDEGRKAFKSDTGIEHVVERDVTITRVFNRGGVGGEYYLSVDAQGIQWPRALATNSGNAAIQQATGIDGFFQVGMPAVYRLEKRPDGTVSHYFKGGINLSETRVVELTGAPVQIGDVFVAGVRTFTSYNSPITGEQISVDPFTFNNVPFLDQNAVNTSLSSGDRVIISSHGNKKELVPGADYGPNTTRDNDLFIVNNAVPNSSFPATVTTEPDAISGRNGAIRSFDAVGGQTFTDGLATNGRVYNIFFIGVEPDQVVNGDIGSVFQFQEQGSDQFRLYVVLNRPTFVLGSALVG